MNDEATERIVVTIGMIVTYGVTALFSIFFAVLAVGDGSATGIYVFGGAFFVATLACFAYSIQLARAKKHVRAILLGLLPIPFVVSMVYAITALMNWSRG